MRSGRLWLGLFLLALLAGAFPRPSAAQTMDHYTLIMAFLPGQCLVKPELPLCKGLTLKDTAARNLILVGLRPDPRANSVPLRDCDPMASAFSTPLMEGEVETLATQSCTLPPVKLSPDLSRALAEVMPATTYCAERRFWSSYGACSMLSQERYFQRAVDRAIDMRRTLLNVAIASAIGTRVKRDALVDSFTQQFGDESAGSLQLVCGRSEKRHLAVLTEVRVKLRQLGTMKQLAKDGMWLEDGSTLRHRCPDEFLIPEAGQPVPDPIAKPAAPGAVDIPQMPDIPQPDVPTVTAPTVTVPEITAPQAAPPLDPTKPQPMDTEPMQIIPPLSE
jgi:ribonuclease I